MYLVIKFQKPDTDLDLGFGLRSETLLDTLF